MKLINFSWVVGLLIFFLLDRLIKNLVWNSSVEFAGEFFIISPYLNQDGPFSLPLANIIMVIITIPLLIWLVSLALTYFGQKNFFSFWGTGLMIVGGFSNLWDRLIWGGVIDVWQITWPSNMHFNLADVLLMIGLCFLLRTYYQVKKVY